MTAIRVEHPVELSAPPERIWPLAADTDLVNRFSNLPPVTYRFETLPGGGVRTRATAKFFGLFPAAWEEKPFEWRRPERFRVERIFESGPIDRLRIGADFAPHGSGTRAVVSGEIEVRNGFFAPVARAIAASQAKDFARLLRRFDAEACSGTGEILRAKELRKGAADAEALSRARDRAAKALDVSRHPILDRLVEDLATLPDREVVAIRPFVWADARSLDRVGTLETFLHATREGLLDLEWSLLCPHCKGRPSSVHRLAELPKEADCPSCSERFLVEFDQAVEVRFSVSSAVRVAEAAIYCRGGPMNTPFIRAQYRVPPGGRIEIPAEILAGAALAVRPKDGLAKTGDRSYENRGAVEAVAAVEETEWETGAASAAFVATLPTFQSLFASDVLAPGQEVAVRRLVVFFSDLTGSTALYREIGDARAFAIVRDHFKIFDEVLAKHSGVFVKTMGDAVMAVFPRAQDALAASHEAHARMTPPILLKIGLHAGPLFAIRANDRNDYFGSTVNIAARLVGLADSGETVVSRAVAEEGGIHGAGERVPIKGIEAPIEVFRLAKGANG